MHLNANQLPTHLREDYSRIVHDYNKLINDVKDYQTSLIPRYVSIPRYFDELGLKPSYQDMLKLAEIAQNQARGQFKIGKTYIGDLLCFNEDLLDKCLDLMTLEGDEDD